LIDLTTSNNENFMNSLAYRQTACVLKRSLTVSYFLG